MTREDLENGLDEKEENGTKNGSNSMQHASLSELQGRKIVKAKRFEQQTGAVKDEAPPQKGF